MGILKSNAVFKYGLGVPNADGSITLPLTCSDPGEGSGLSAAFTVTLTTGDVTTIANAGTAAQKKAALDAIVIAYLTAQYRIPTATAGVQSALQSLVGQTVTVS